MTKNHSKPPKLTDVAAQALRSSDFGILSDADWDSLIAFWGWQQKRDNHYQNIIDNAKRTTPPRPNTSSKSAPHDNQSGKARKG